MSAALRQLDRARPYATVYGLPGASYEQDQDGKPVLFNMAGLEVLPESTAPVNHEPEAVEEDRDEDIKPATVTVSPEAPVAEKGVNYDKMSNKQLKVILETFGGEWENRDSALLYLRGKTQ